MTTDEAAFRAAIKAAPLDVAPRYVYADWLDEHDRPEEAAAERAWTVERLAARKRIDDFAARIGQTYETMMEAADLWVSQQDKGAMVWGYTYDNSESYKDISWKLWPEFWEQYEAVAGIEVKEKECPFTCSC